MVVHELAHGFYEDIAIFLTITLIAALIGFFRNVRNCLDRQNARTLRLAKAMELLAHEISKFTGFPMASVRRILSEMSITGRLETKLIYRLK